MNIPNLRLISQQLINPQFSKPQEVVAWMGAMQAQDYNMCKWAVGVRLPESTEKQVQKALDEGAILRTHVMRPTWHLVVADDIRWMVELTAARIFTQVQSRDKMMGLNEKIFDHSNRVLHEALKNGKHLTKDELSVCWEDAGIDTSEYRMYHLLMRAELEALICSGAMKGKKQTYALIEERAPKAKTYDRETSLGMLAKRYFASHGPATVQDFVWWSNLSMADGKKGIEMLGNGFTALDFDGQRYFMLKTLKEMDANNRVHLLPAFDEMIIAYRDRSAVIADEHNGKAISSNGIFRPTIMKNGEAIGLWKKIRKKNVIEIEPSYFEKPLAASVFKTAAQEIIRFED